LQAAHTFSDLRNSQLAVVVAVNGLQLFGKDSILQLDIRQINGEALLWFFNRLLAAFRLAEERQCLH